MSLTGKEAVEDAHFQCGLLGRRRSFRPGITVDEVVKIALDHRTSDVLFVACQVRRGDGVIVKYVTRFEPGQTKAEWMVRG